MERFNHSTASAINYLFGTDPRKPGQLLREFSTSTDRITLLRVGYHHNSNGNMDIHRSAVMIALLSLSLSKSGMGPALKGNHRQDAADFNQKLQQGYDQIRAAHALMEQTMKQHAAFQANFDGGARSAADHWSDMIRGVDTVNDPSNGGATQLSNLGQYHFTVGFGNYRSR